MCFLGRGTTLFKFEHSGTTSRLSNYVFCSTVASACAVYFPYERFLTDFVINLDFLLVCCSAASVNFNLTLSFIQSINGQLFYYAAFSRWQYSTLKRLELGKYISLR